MSFGVAVGSAGRHKTYTIYQNYYELFPSMTLGSQLAEASRSENVQKLTKILRIGAATLFSATSLVTNMVLLYPHKSQAPRYQLSPSPTVPFTN